MNFMDFKIVGIIVIFIYMYLDNLVFFMCDVLNDNDNNLFMFYY